MADTVVVTLDNGTRQINGGQPMPRIEVSAASGNVKPWNARVFIADKFVGSTGFCKTSSAARRAGERLAAKFTK